MADRGQNKDERFVKPVQVIAGLEDTNVTTAVLLGDSLNTSLNTTNKTLIGSINEVESSAESPWKRLSTTISPVNSGDDVELDGSLTVVAIEISTQKISLLDPVAQMQFEVKDNGEFAFVTRGGEAPLSLNSATNTAAFGTGFTVSAPTITSSTSIIGNVGITGNIITTTSGGLEITTLINASIALSPHGTGKVIATKEIDSTSAVFAEGGISGYGDIEGFVVKYSTTTAVTITQGFLEANTSHYILASDGTHNMTSLAAGFDLHYIYIDDSASTEPTATIIDATTEPSYSSAKGAWYNGDDRCIGVVVSPATGSTISYFDTEILSSKQIEYKITRDDFPALATNMNPDGTWQTPGTTESSVVVPVNAQSIFVRMFNTDAAARVELYTASSEFAAVVSTVTAGPVYRIGFDSLGILDKVTLGASRNIKIAGANANENNLSADCAGFGISR